MRPILCVRFVVWVTLCLTATITPMARAADARPCPVPPPPFPTAGLAGAELAGAGVMWHGVYPGGISGEEDDLTPADVQAYEDAAGRRVAWVYFSNNWYASRRFPAATAQWIRQRGAIPYIRLMLRSRDHALGHGEKLFSLQAIIDGKFDADLAAWGRDAKAFGTPLLVEYGTEVNGQWFGWNGKFHGGGQTKNFGDPGKPDGPERFVAAYRHIVSVMRGAGADNIAWVFHLDTAQDPPAAWNRFENYYPGPDVVDWLAVSCYGPQQPGTDDDVVTFAAKFAPVYPRIVALAPDKPIIVAEFGCTSGHKTMRSADWAAAALDDLLARRWPHVVAFSWWNERWENDDDPRHDTTMRLQDNPALARAFHDRLAGRREVAEPPVLMGTTTQP